MLRKTASGLLAIAAVASLAAACGSTSSSSRPTTSVTTTTYKLPPQVLTPTTVIDGKTITVPVQQPSGKPIASYNDTGSQILITDEGVLPFHLFADLGATITWTNLGAKAVTITSYAKDFGSPSIPPGGTFQWKSDTGISERYRVSSGFDGRIDVGAFPH